MRKHDAESAHAGTSLTEKPYAPPDYSYTPLPASTPPKEKKGCLRTALKTAAFLIGACLALFVLSLAVVFPKHWGTSFPCLPVITSMAMILS